MSLRRTLQDFPELLAWYDDACRTGPGDCSMSDLLALKTCRVLATVPDITLLKNWIHTLRESFAIATDLRSELLAVISHFHEHGADFTESMGDLTHLAVSLGIGDSLFPILQMGADKSNFAALRFLAAWTAFNLDRLDTCIDECDKVDEPYAPLHALQGQAYLALGRARDAIEALHVATTLDPGDIVAWFQKAKALHVANRSQEAFETLKVCERLAPNSNEVALFSAIVAQHLKDSPAIQEHAWTRLRQHLTTSGHLPPVPFTLLRLAFAMDDRPKAEDVVTHVLGPINLRNPQEFRDLSDILTLCQKRAWMTVAAQLLQKVTCGDALAH